MEMTRRQLLFLSLSGLPAFAKGVLDWQRENLWIADRLERSRASGRLLLLKPTASNNAAALRGNPKKFFHSYPVRAQAALGVADTRELLGALVKSLRSYSITDGVSSSFRPGHALVLATGSGVEMEILISFECSQLYCFGQGRPLHGYLRGGESHFKRMARELNLE